MTSRPPLPNNPNITSPPNYNNNQQPASPLLHRRNDSQGLLSGERESAIDDRRSEISGAGYSAYSGHRASEEPNYHMRLVRFYQRYNPEKIPRVAEFLEAYRGEEEELFKTLSQKYGPEPEPSVISLGSRSETNRQQIGVATVPKIVSKEEGNCDRETPYYPSQRTIMESDLCNLLATKKTTHADLAHSYVGYLTAHPSSAWNGLTYVTNVPVPIDEESRFLGHLWAGSLSNTKTIVHEKVAYTRTVFHCGESCSSGQFQHERWRLTLIRCDHMQDCLYRVLWDPVLSPAAAAELLKAAPNAVEQDRSFFSSFFRRQNSEKLKSGTGSVTGGGGAVGAAKPVSSGFSSRSQQHHASQQQQQQQAPYQPPQPQQPPAYPPPMQLSPPTAPNQQQHHQGGGTTSPPNNNNSGASTASPTNAHQHQTNVSNNYNNTNQPPPPHHHSNQQHHQPQQPSQPPVSGATPSPAGGAGGGANGRPPSSFHQQQHHQPQQPQMVSSFDTLINLVQGLEGRLTERLNDLDRRLQAVEGDIVFLKEVSEQRQIEQLPEPWLDDGGTSHQGSSAAPGMQQSRAHKKMKKELSQKEKAQAIQRYRRRQHRKRLESERNRLDGDDRNGHGGGGDDHADGTETVLTTSVGTSIATSGYR